MYVDDPHKYAKSKSTNCFRAFKTSPQLGGPAPTIPLFPNKIPFQNQRFNFNTPVPQLRFNEILKKTVTKKIKNRFEINEKKSKMHDLGKTILACVWQ